ncbi:hypothetical protein COU24_01430 [Candidatus Kuenenbacteria bacterium CG10_big_fil_rev_8_21_14_0_10_39_14]|uniref:AbiEi antitoxin C-terminal domain-containing protein n=6 Tax=Candidatus Kueneniibacteriota TaxID=1752740 RepID=A0A2M7MFZ3_9BACT|nr:MAG: hypothetical protein COX28_02380 [Candidatus Kuenenbacteria bacterium CG23_combo_of_CG06-09_8_20_14_all_39_39]PIR80906.1 MAG: hypothetical protein COU24_01430 [Candidatus Kuenenbacteria bacterium CG10_big_fil_rev_8_21_14_0_10_39_14]PIX92033.1 MAG: hypothetical protein COZ26_03990 [Candidatus Kuenenbacteria bacterium CG_4_10_14_3_um_filter_39_14]
MRNKSSSKIEKIMFLAEHLPCFTLSDLAVVETNRHYLKVLFSRYGKAGKLIRLKRGFYVAKEYLDITEKKGQLSFYLEFIARLLYLPAYLSLDYVLYEHNILTEIPRNFTLVTKNKTTRLVNQFGNFFYHKIKDELFGGFEIIKKNNLAVFKATKAKALFDFFYLRKNILNNEKAVAELRLNLDNFSPKDWQEFKKYFTLENSKKMKEIFGYLLKTWKK